MSNLKESKPEGALKWGKCSGCDEETWLFPWEGTCDNPNDLMCEGCIDEAHERMRDAEDAMASGEESWDEEEGLGYDEEAYCS